MTTTRRNIFAALLVLAFYDIIAEWHINPWDLPTISRFINENIYQFHFWEVGVGLALGHLIFNRNNAKPGT